jgi:integrase/recombinase XerC
MAELIEQYLEWLRIRDCTQRTRGARHEILHRLDRDLPCGLTAATADELKAWLYRDGWSKSTKSTYYGAIRGFFVWATNPLDPKLDFDPTAMLPRPSAPQGIPKPVTDAELAHILDCAAEPYLTWARLAAYQGLRCIEISRLRRQDVSEDITEIHRGKGEKPGVVPTHPLVWDSMRGRPAGQIAFTREGHPASARYISLHALLYFTRKLDLPGVSMHRLRHWFGTNIYKKTRDLRRTQELMRHASPTSTAIYTLISDEERRLAVEALPVPTETLQGTR